jgi:branched-chain amino acid transport system permease protein
MLYRLAGIRHTTYGSARRLYPVPFDRALVAVLIATAIAAPFLLTPLQLGSYLIPWIVWSTAALGLNLLMGWAGQVHLGYAAVMAIGAYTAIHSARIGIPFPLAVLLGGLASASVGLLFGAAALRVKGLYLAVTTLAMQTIVDWTIQHVPAISGGSQATLQTPVIRLGWWQVETDAGRYWLALAVCFAVTVFLLNVQRTSFGRALIAVREKDFAAAIVGVNPFKFKLVAFWTSSFIGGCVGALLAFCYYRAVTPEQFHLEVSIQVVAMVIVGGLGSVLGSFLGAGLILLAPIILNRLVVSIAVALDLPLHADVLSHIPLVLYGALIVGFLVLEPLGLAKVYHNARNYFLVWPFRHARH